MHFAREYWGKPLKFLTLTGATGKTPSRIELQILLEHLRKISDIQYMGVRTQEGNGVYHLALMSGYIDQALIREKWESLTGASQVHISRERSINALVREMTRQHQTVRYSMSRKFIPKGSQHALDSIARQYRGITRIWAYQMFARRCKLHKDRPDCADRAYNETVICIRQLAVGACTDIRTKIVYNVNEILVG